MRKGLVCSCLELAAIDGLEVDDIITDDRCYYTSNLRFNESNRLILRLIVFYFQEVAKHTRCNRCHSGLPKTLLDSCIDQYIETRDLNCGLATLRYMVENFLIFLVTESRYSFLACFGVFVLRTLIYLWYECFVFVIWFLTGRL